MDETAFDALIGDIYLAATDEAVRQRLPGALARLAGGVQAAFWTFDPRTGVPASRMVTNLPAETEPLYRDYYHRIDPWRNAFDPARLGEVQTGAELISDEALGRSEYYNDFGRRIGTFHLIGACVAIGRDHAAPMGRLSIIRPQRQEAFTTEEVRRLRRVLPHLQRAWQLGEQIGPGGRAAAASWQAGAATVLQGLRVAALVTDGHGRVLAANAAAERLDAAGVLRLAGAPPGREIVLAGESGPRVRAAIAEAAGGGAGMEAVLPLGTAGPCRVTVSPLPRPAGAWRAGPGRALVTVLPQALPRDEAALGRARRLFGLTRSEAEVALALADGASPSEIAEARGVRMPTVRTQLAQAMEKAGADDLRGLAIRLTLLRG